MKASNHRQLIEINKIDNWWDVPIFSTSPGLQYTGLQYINNEGSKWKINPSFAGGSCDFSHEIIPLSEKATKKIDKLEEDRTKKLQEQRVIGREVSKKSETDYRINVRRVNFRWQRGLKIGKDFLL